MYRLLIDAFCRNREAVQFSVFVVVATMAVIKLALWTYPKVEPLFEKLLFQGGHDEKVEDVVGDCHAP